MTFLVFFFNTELWETFSWHLENSLKLEPSPIWKRKKKKKKESKKKVPLYSYDMLKFKIKYPDFHVTKHNIDSWNKTTKQRS